MAIFLAIALIFSSLAAFGKTSYHVNAGILGGPATSIAAEAVHFDENIAMLESTPMTSETYVLSDYGSDEGILKSAMLSIDSSADKEIADKVAKGKTDSADADLEGYLSMPTEGFNWGKLHSHNAVDIANACGTPIRAAAEGLIDDISLDERGTGYGHYVMISHPAGIKTRYAHMNKIFISVGQYVKKGEQIGTMGRTGDATGCHVHFEVYGATNPFAR
ncbi:MAG: M23 family metallopeptidase [Candidatus Liptonbacteria bacterium]|nr:M23 family metallopeptidase [Candidatus Liptonbacteria bacterium]